MLRASPPGRSSSDAPIQRCINDAACTQPDPCYIHAYSQKDDPSLASFIKGGKSYVGEAAMDKQRRGVTPAAAEVRVPAVNGAGLDEWNPTSERGAVAAATAAGSAAAGIQSGLRSATNRTVLKPRALDATGHTNMFRKPVGAGSTNTTGQAAAHDVRRGPLTAGLSADEELLAMAGRGVQSVASGPEVMASAAITGGIPHFSRAPVEPPLSSLPPTAATATAAPAAAAAGGGGGTAAAAPAASTKRKRGAGAAAAAAPPATTPSATRKRSKTAASASAPAATAATASAAGGGGGGTPAAAAAASATPVRVKLAQYAHGQREHTKARVDALAASAGLTSPMSPARDPIADDGSGGAYAAAGTARPLSPVPEFEGADDIETTANKAAWLSAPFRHGGKSVTRGKVCAICATANRDYDKFCSGCDQPL